MDSVIDCLCSAFNKMDDKRRMYENLYSSSKLLIVELKDSNDVLIVECSKLRCERDRLANDVELLYNELRHYKGMNDNLRTMLTNVTKTKRD